MRVAVLGVLASSLCKGLPASADVVHTVIMLALWSLGLNADGIVREAEAPAGVPDPEAEKAKKTEADAARCT